MDSAIPYPVKRVVGKRDAPLTFDQLLQLNHDFLHTLHHGIIPGHESKHPKKLVGLPLNHRHSLHQLDDVSSIRHLNIEGLILLKSKSARPKDQNDVLHLQPLLSNS